MADDDGVGAGAGAAAAGHAPLLAAADRVDGGRVGGATWTTYRRSDSERGCMPRFDTDTCKGSS
eukprot:gene41933-22945_t